jgi:histone deacetylase complex regulatory component SIN3
VRFANIGSNFEIPPDDTLLTKALLVLLHIFQQELIRGKILIAEIVFHLQSNANLLCTSIG